MRARLYCCCRSTQHHTAMQLQSAARRKVVVRKVQTTTTQFQAALQSTSALHRQLMMCITCTVRTRYACTFNTTINIPHIHLDCGRLEQKSDAQHEKAFAIVQKQTHKQSPRSDNRADLRNTVAHAHNTSKSGTARLTPTDKRILFVIQQRQEMTHSQTQCTTDLLTIRIHVHVYNTRTH